MRSGMAKVPGHGQEADQTWEQDSDGLVNNAGRSGEGGAINFFGAGMGSCIAVFDCDKGKSAVLEGEQAYYLYVSLFTVEGRNLY